jgi:ribose transport system substrate-binding protein
LAVATAVSLAWVVAGNTSTTVRASSKATCGGPIPTKAVQDPQGVVAKEGALVKAAFNGYPVPVHPSPWQQFKPNHGPPWVIGWAWNELNAYATGNRKGIDNNLAVYKKLGLVSSIVPTYTTVANGATQQAQQIRTMVQKKVDIIISALTSPTAVNGAIAAAAAANIPVVSESGTSTDPHAVNVQGNPYLLGAQTATALANIMGQKGNLLIVDGVPGLSIATFSLAAAKDIFKNCPNIKVVGEVVGFFSQSTAKNEVLKFLATHPGQIDGVWQDSSMAQGVISAFQQLGRKVPPVADTSADLASLAYWLHHMKDGYKGTANGDPAQRMADAVWNVSMRMLEGQGVKFTDIPIVPPIITAHNLAQWVPSNWNESVSHTAEGPPNSWGPNAYLDHFFLHPANPLKYKP